MDVNSYTENSKTTVHMCPEDKLLHCYCLLPLDNTASYKEVCYAQCNSQLPLRGLYQ